MTAAYVPRVRTDVLTGRRVIVAPGRQARPLAVTQALPTEQRFDPFLEGNETETPAERYSVRCGDSRPDQPGWLLRAVPNRYPIVSDVSESTASCDAAAAEFFPEHDAVGVHDVVIECPDGRSRLRHLSAEELQRVLTAWQVRVGDLLRQDHIADVVVFRNEGFSAGASLPHCHSQIVGFASIAPGFEARRRAAAGYRSRDGRELTQSWLAAEHAAGDRIVEVGHGVNVLCPFAPRSNFHLRLLMDQPAPRFEELNQAALHALACSLYRSLERLDNVLGACDFNILLPICGTRHRDQFPWVLDVVPRTSRVAGWELLTDVDIVTVTPESAAAQLRSSPTSSA